MKVRSFVCAVVLAVPLFAGAADLDLLVPLPREAVRRNGEVDAASVRTAVRRTAVPGAPAETADEAYVLEVTPTGTVITASSERGERWARVTLDQLARLAGGRIPCCRIVDWPQFKWRGFMHDSARNFLELADVKGLIDIMSRAKLNLFHWHLTEYYGWRLESKRHPELQKDGAFFRRYIGKYYTQAEFREILDYARARGVTVMPEFDVPGHALAFRRAFGFRTMRDEGVREKLCDLVDELCTLAPPELMPFVHIGSDEASAPDEKVPSGWLEPIVDRIRAAGRTVVGWMPGELNGLPDRHGIVGMRWGKDPGKGIPCFDACGMYVDTMDPFEFLGVTTYRRVCPWVAADGARLGAVTCAWHDDFAGEGRRTIGNQALVPALVMSADAYWCGRDNRKAGGTCRVLPRGDDPSLADAAAFERRMVAQRDKVYADVPYPFQFLCQTAMRWRVTRPDGSLVAKDVAGATLSFWQVWLGKDENLLRGERMGTAIAETWIRSPKDQDVGAWIGFTDYNRNHGRACSGPTPALGQWNKHGASVTINGEKVEPPKWKRPGQTSGPAVKEIEGVHELDEIPFEDEEYYMRAPTKIHLRKGWNHVRLTVPMTEKTGYYRPWTATFAPLLGTTEHPKEVPGLDYSSEPKVGLEFSRPAGECWQDGFFLGDGVNGVLAYAPQHLEWTINRNSVYNPYAGKNEEVPHAEVLKRIEAMEWKNVSFLQAADRIVSPRGDQSTVTPVQLRLRFWPDLAWSAPAAPSVDGRLDLAEGRLSEHVSGSRLDRTVETVVPRDRDVVALRVDVKDAKGSPSILNVVRPDNVLLGEDPKWTNRDDLVAFEQTLPAGGRYAVAVAWRGATRQKSDAYRLEHEAWFDAGRLELFVAVRAWRDAADPLAAAVAAAESARTDGFAALAAENAGWWTRFWNETGRVSFDSEPEIGLRWNLALFTMACTYGASPMPGLNGLAYAPYTAAVAGVGAQGYTHDQNAQIPFFAFLPLGRCDWVRVFAKTYLDVLPQLRAYTRARFGCEGVGLPLCMNQDGREIPTRDYRYTLCGSAYSGLVLSLAWRYSRDRQLLADWLYPLLKEFCLFHLAQMTKGADGRYHHSWGVPPEIFTVTRDDSATLAMLHTDLETLVEASEILGTDAELRARAIDVLAHWPEQTYLDDGTFWAGPDIPKDHYHYGGHLMYPFFPAEMLTDAAAQSAALKAVDYARNHGLDWSWQTPNGGAHARHEWSAYLTGMARIRAGTDGWQALREFLDWFGKPNGLFSHNAVIIGDCAKAERSCADFNKSHPNVRRSWNGTMREYRLDSDDVTENPSAKAKVSMVAESTSAYLQMATETVLQSWGGRIRLFPCVPKDFTGSFTNLLAEGGYRVSAAMEKGSLVSYSIEPLPGAKPIDDPRIFRGDEKTAYRDPAAIWHDGVFHVYFTLVETEPDRTIHSYVARTESRDLKTWTTPVKITPKSVMDYSSPGNVVLDGDEWVICYQSYPRPGNVADGKIRYGNGTARLFTARSKDLRNWSAPELIRVKGPDVAEKDMGRMIDPYLLRGEDGVWRCFYKQEGGADGREGACFSKSPDLKTWECVGYTEAGENVCVVKADDRYLMMHSPHNGLGLKSSADLVRWQDVPGLVTLDQDKWPWARGRLTAGCLLDARQVPGVGSWLLFFHGSGPQDERVDFDRNASLAVVKFDLNGALRERACVDRPLIVFDTDIHGDYDDIGALATLHALADRGECGILATVSSTRGNASVAAIEIVNAHYGRPGIPVGAARGEGAVSGDTEAYRRLARDYAQWVRHGNADDAPDAVEVYRRVLASAPDRSVTVCTVGYLSNLRRLLESGADAASPLTGRELVARKVRVWCCQACKSPRGKAWNSCHDAASARVAINTWPTPVVFCDWDYGARVYAGRRLVEMPDGNGPVRDVFRWMLTPREKCRVPVVSGDAQDGHAAWDQVTVLAAVRGVEPMFSSERGRFAIVDDEGTDEWTGDAQGRHLRLADGWSKAEVGRDIDDLMCAKPRPSRR